MRLMIFVLVCAVIGACSDGGDDPPCDGGAAGADMGAGGKRETATVPPVGLGGFGGGGAGGSP